MSIKDVLQKAGEKLTNRPVEQYDDNETRDKYLRSLRRERRIQIEQEEKKRLMAQIESYKKKQRNKHLFGMGENILRTKSKDIKKKTSHCKWF